jgi:glycosyltransferase involved in cell wall biosynthesis
VRKIEKLNLDIVHFHTPSPVGLLGAYIATKHNLPLVTTYHTDMYQYVSHYPALFPGILALALVAPLAIGGNAEDFEVALSLIKPERKIDTWNKKMVTRMTTVVHNRCDLVISPSQKIKTQLLSWGTTSPIKVLPTGIDELITTPPQTEEFRSRYGLTESDEVILFVGRLGSEKNVDLLLNAMALISPKRPRAKLVLVGDDKYRVTLMRVARQLGLKDKVVFTGYIEHAQLGSAYAVARVFAFPSQTDTQGLVLNEAAWAGVPVVMTDSGITDVIKGGVNGLFAKNNPRSFAHAILELLQTPALHQAMAKTARKEAARYSASKQTAKLLRLYEEAQQHHD